MTSNRHESQIFVLFFGWIDLVHLARSAIISYCFNGLDRWQPFFPARLVYTKCISKVKHEKMLLGWIDSNWAKIPSSNLSYFHQLKQIESIREGSWTNFVIGVSGWSNIPHSATTPHSAIINITCNFREAAYYLFLNFLNLSLNWAEVASKKCFRKCWC